MRIEKNIIIRSRVAEQEVLNLLDEPAKPDFVEIAESCKGISKKIMREQIEKFKNN